MFRSTATTTQAGNLPARNSQKQAPPSPDVPIDFDHYRRRAHRLREAAITRTWSAAGQWAAQLWSTLRTRVRARRLHAALFSSSQP